MMGYSYSQDDGPIMCFNGAKSWQTGWYTPKSKVINPGDVFAANLYGIADYNNVASSFVLFKINDSSATDIYVAYNRKSGINSGTQEAGNQVTITQAGGKGTSYAESELLAKLSANKSWTGIVSGMNMTVHVMSIDASLQFARVCVAGNINDCFTTPPTASPTSVPTSSLTSVPTSSPTSVPSSRSTSSPTASPTSVPSGQPTSWQPVSARPSLIYCSSIAPSESASSSVSPSESPTSGPTTTKPSAEPTAKPTSSTLTLSPTSVKPVTALPTTRRPSLKPTRKPTRIRK